VVSSLIGICPAEGEGPGGKKIVDLLRRGVSTPVESRSHVSISRVKIVAKIVGKCSCAAVFSPGR
jgi:hypothetical protein